MRIAVIGDIMVDKYTNTSPTKISDEAPVMVVLKKEVEYRLGGAANVALNLVKLGEEVELVGYVGRDLEGYILKELIEKEGITSNIVDGENPTTVKHRILCNGYQLLRIDEEVIYSHPINLKDKYDIVVVSDYAKGTVNSFTMARVLKLGKFIIVNGKPSQIELYEGVNILTFNLKEFQECKKETGCTSGEHICGRYAIKYLIVTEGAKGLTLYTEKNKVAVPGISVKVTDVTGAGDTVIAVLTFAMKKYKNIKRAALLANKAGAIVVQKNGTSFVTLEELLEPI